MLAFGFLVMFFGAILLAVGVYDRPKIAELALGMSLFIGGCALVAGGFVADVLRQAARPLAANSPGKPGAASTAKTASTPTADRPPLAAQEPMIDLVLALAPGDAALDALLAYLRSAVRDQTGADAIDWSALKSRLKDRRPREADARATLAEIGQWSAEAKDRAAATLAEIYRLVLAPDPVLRADIARVLGRAV